MTEQDAIKYIENFGWSKTRLGLERTFELLEKMGNPQKKLKFIHVAGSNGKGSTCAMFESILRAEGYKTGLYISPYIQDFCERIQVNGENIDGEDLARITEKVKDIADKMEDHPSQFELVTAIGMQYFYEQKCDIVVLEVGMGGALDSTNVIDAPELACITNIGLEHTEYLGNTLEEIAGTKAGIIKPGCSCVCYDGAPEVTGVIKDVCDSLNVTLKCVDFSRLVKSNNILDETDADIFDKLKGQKFIWSSGCNTIDKTNSASAEYELGLIGTHQLHNAALVLTGVESLREKGWKISDEAIKYGLKNVKWPARFEVLSREPVVILDGGHNPQCAKAMAESLTEIFPGQKVTFLTGVLKDKNYDEIIDILMPYSKEFVCVTPVSERALCGEEFCEHLKSKGAKACACETIEEGITEALNRTASSESIVIFGSLYLAGEARTIFHNTYRKWIRNTKIIARDNIPIEERKTESAKIVEQVIELEEYKNSKKILIYEAVKGEVSLETLKEKTIKTGKQLLFPKCISSEEMVALYPLGDENFSPGYCGIPEPMVENSIVIGPEKIDLVICPCTSFDEDCNRMGMGGGFYDRYLTKCKNAKILAVAFEIQKSAKIPKESWDKSVDAVITEKSIYRNNNNIS